MVLGIIGLLLAIVIPSISQVRQNSRDKQRLTDLAQIALGLQIEKEFANSYPSGTNVEIGNGGALDSIIASRMGRVLADPLDSGSNNSSYGYYYSDSYNCNGATLPAVYIQQFETNRSELGDCGSGIYALALPQ